MPVLPYRPYAALLPTPSSRFLVFHVSSVPRPWKLGRYHACLLHDHAQGMYADGAIMQASAPSNDMLITYMNAWGISLEHPNKCRVCRPRREALGVVGSWSRRRSDGLCTDQFEWLVTIPSAYPCIRDQEFMFCHTFGISLR
jgi:hypothetical protein